MDSAEEIKYMRRAIELASLSAGRCRPNPMVGAVIVHKGTVIGEGYHLKAGGPHAEVVAIASVKKRELLKESILYVNLEPCSHYGKTPPCADLILKEAIPRVVIGAVDTSKNVSGQGIKILEEGGCEVSTGVLGDECRYLNRRFFTFNEMNRPWVLLKWAESSDGFMNIGGNGKERTGPTWITGKDERMLVHKWRSEEHSILVGANTARIDDPLLNVRYWTGPDPIRLVLTRSGNLPARLRLLSDNDPTIIYSIAGQKTGNTVEFVTLSEWDNAPEELLNDLKDREIQSVMIEGGTIVLNQFIEKGLWDEARVFVGKESFRQGVRSPMINGIVFEVDELKNSVLTYYLNEPGNTAI